MILVCSASVTADLSYYSLITAWGLRYHQLLRKSKHLQITIKVMTSSCIEPVERDTERERGTDRQTDRQKERELKCRLAAVKRIPILQHSAYYICYFLWNHSLL